MVKKTFILPLKLFCFNNNICFPFRSLILFSSFRHSSSLNFNNRRSLLWNASFKRDTELALDLRLFEAMHNLLMPLRVRFNSLPATFKQEMKKQDQRHVYHESMWMPLKLRNTKKTPYLHVHVVDILI